MNNGESYESKLWAVLTKEGLVDLSQFHARDVFDEVPLYSRDSDVDFLFADSLHDGNGFLPALCFEVSQIGHLLRGTSLAIPRRHYTLEHARR